MRQNILLVALSALGVATAQSQNFTIDPNSINPSLKGEWCNAEYNTCRILCAENPTANECDATTLKYVCTCQNGTAPGLDYYTQTIPYFICDKAFSDCIAANTGSSRAQDECKTNIKNKCGSLDPTKADVGGSSDEASSSSGAAAATNAVLIGNGVAMVAAGVFAALL
ncbi:hypothetical protein N0V88_004760 [Collariella sp. IMI 366227]|nr:hypothetical protein N0V88_004760 [Collariella sp. IMI 366227]